MPRLRSPVLYGAFTLASQPDQRPEYQQLCTILKPCYAYLLTNLLHSARMVYHDLFNFEPFLLNIFT
jgi:hypothetical protein